MGFENLGIDITKKYWDSHVPVEQNNIATIKVGSATPNIGTQYQKDKASFEQKFGGGKSPLLDMYNSFHSDGVDINSYEEQLENTE